jgi:hypothetical protein
LSTGTARRQSHLLAVVGEAYRGFPVDFDFRTEPVLYMLACRAALVLPDRVGPFPDQALSVGSHHGLLLAVAFFTAPSRALDWSGDRVLLLVLGQLSDLCCR